MKIIIPVGISFSGKTTKIVKKFDQDFDVISPDQLRKKISGDINNQTVNGKVFQEVYHLIKKNIENDVNTFLDATNTNYDLLVKLLNFIEKVKNEEGASVTVLIIFVPITVETALKRKYTDKEQNLIQKGERANVPDQILEKQFDGFQNVLSKRNTLESEYYFVKTKIL